MKKTKALFVIAILLGALAWTTPIHAQPSDPGAEATATDTTTAPASDASAEDLLRSGGDIARATSDYEKLGLLGLLVAIVNFLMVVTKVRAINDWLKERKLKWVRPLAATVLATGLGALSSLQTGLPVVQSLLAGFMAGLGSVGFHELTDILKKSGREKRAT